MTQGLWTSEEATHACLGKSTLPWEAQGVSIDSRKVEPGDLFIALPGEKVDGHSYVKAAFEKGAIAAMVSHVPSNVDPSQSPLLIVQDTVKGLEDLGRYARARMTGKVIGVTGSVGKTSVKEMLKAAFAIQGETFASYGNLNNHYGTPLSLSQCPKDVDFAIFEMGMNHEGEIRALTAMVRPHVAIITTVEPVHLEFFKNVEGIADAKAEIFEGLEPDGVAVLNRDNPHYDRLVRRAKACKVKKILSFGKHHDSQFKLITATQDHSEMRVTAQCVGQTLSFKLHLLGMHQAFNAMGVLAVVHGAGGNIQQAAYGLSNLTPREGRGKEYIIRFPSGVCLIIDDSYNASPASISAGLAVLEERKKVMGGRSIAILGDMLELGPKGTELHAKLADPVNHYHTDLVLTSGPLMEHLQNLLPKEKQGGHFTSSDVVGSSLLPMLKSGDVLLIKGSRGMKMEKLLHYLLEHGDVAGTPGGLVDAC